MSLIRYFVLEFTFSIQISKWFIFYVNVQKARLQKIEQRQQKKNCSRPLSTMSSQDPQDSGSHDPQDRKGLPLTTLEWREALIGYTFFWKDPSELKKMYPSLTKATLRSKFDELRRQVAPSLSNQEFRDQVLGGPSLVRVLVAKNAKLAQITEDTIYSFFTKKTKGRPKKQSPVRIDEKLCFDCLWKVFEFVPKKELPKIAVVSPRLEAALTEYNLKKMHVLSPEWMKKKDATNSCDDIFHVGDTILQVSTGSPGKVLQVNSEEQKVLVSWEGKNWKSVWLSTEEVRECHNLGKRKRKRTKPDRFGVKKMN